MVKIVGTGQKVKRLYFSLMPGFHVHKPQKTCESFSFYLVMTLHVPYKYDIMFTGLA